MMSGFAAMQLLARDNFDRHAYVKWWWWWWSTGDKLGSCDVQRKRNCSLPIVLQVRVASRQMGKRYLECARLWKFPAQFIWIPSTTSDIFLYRYMYFPSLVMMPKLKLCAPNETTTWILSYTGNFRCFKQGELSVVVIQEHCADESDNRTFSLVRFNVEFSWLSLGSLCVRAWFEHWVRFGWLGWCWFWWWVYASAESSVQLKVLINQLESSALLTATAAN